MRIAYIFLLAFAGWTSLFWYHYVYNIKQVHIAAPSTSVVTTETKPKAKSEVILPVQKQNQLLFKTKTFGPILNGSVSDLVATVLEEETASQLLQITGYYLPQEQLGLDYDLGLARASELKKMLLNQLSEDRIEIFSDTISNFIFYKDSLVEAVTYEWVEGYEKKEPSNYYLVTHETKRIKVENFEALLDQIAERLKLSGETVIIRGHTDDKGDKEINFKIAHRNAKDIRDVFRAKGVNYKQIKTSSQGEDAPIADNTTDAGKLENRRVEIQIK